MVSIDSITDTSRGIVKLTGPCSMSSPCPGLTCPEHGTSNPVTVTPGNVTADAWFYLTDAPEVLERFAGTPFQPTCGWWSSKFHPTYGHEGAKVTLADDSQPANFATYTPDDAPSWVPLPPDGWDLGVRIAAERHAIEAEADQ